MKAIRTKHGVAFDATPNTVKKQARAAIPRPRSGRARRWKKFEIQAENIRRLNEFSNKLSEEVWEMVNQSGYVCPSVSAAAVL